MENRNAIIATNHIGYLTIKCLSAHHSLHEHLLSNREYNFSCISTEHFEKLIMYSTQKLY